MRSSEYADFFRDILCIAFAGTMLVGIPLLFVMLAAWLGGALCK